MIPPPVSVPAEPALTAPAEEAPACATATSVGDVRTAITEAFGAFADNDGPVFESAAQRVDSALGCLSEFLLPADAAEVHRFAGLRSFYRQEPDYAIQSFQSALALQPGYALPTSVAPQPGPLWTMYERAKDRPAPATSPLDLPGYTVLIDGKTSTTRPAMLPYVVQFQAPDGSVKGTSYNGPGVAPVVPAGLPKSSPTSGTTTGTGTATLEQASLRKWRYGFEVGIPVSFVMEHRGKGGLDGYGLRVLFPLVFKNGGIEGFLDVDAGAAWDVNLGVGFAGGPSDYAAAAAFASVSAQYDPPKPFQANLGLALGRGTGGLYGFPNFTLGWLW